MCRAGASCRNIDSLVLQCMQEHFTSDAGKRYADNVCRRSLTVRCIRQKSVDRHLIQFSYALDKSSLASAESGMILIKMTIEHFRCFCKSRNTGHILGTGAEVLLLSATEYDGLDLHPFPYIQQSDALRSVDLVSTDGQQINVHLLGIDPEEIRLATEAGIQPITLGKRILRTETAGFTTIAWLMYQLEN